VSKKSRKKQINKLKFGNLGY